MLGTLGRHGCHRPMSILRRCIAAETRIRGCGTLALGSAIGSERQDAFQESKASQNSMDCAVLPCIARQKHPVSTVCNCMKNEGPLDGRRAVRTQYLSIIDPAPSTAQGGVKRCHPEIMRDGEGIIVTTKLRVCWQIVYLQIPIRNIR